ncbi:hypothetical protein K438DRAFT_1863071 [Mycena galopus ATCC 62051]|nr:hypothetical protein K438DRAFT_1863071 [Mycena galopus ATCC 62051]
MLEGSELSAITHINGGRGGKGGPGGRRGGRGGAGHGPIVINTYNVHAQYATFMNSLGGDAPQINHQDPPLLGGFAEDSDTPRFATSDEGHSLPLLDKIAPGIAQPDGSSQHSPEFMSNPVDGGETENPLESSTGCDGHTDDIEQDDAGKENLSLSILDEIIPVIARYICRPSPQLTPSRATTIVEEELVDLSGIGPAKSDDDIEREREKKLDKRKRNISLQNHLEGKRPIDQVGAPHGGEPGKKKKRKTYDARKKRILSRNNTISENSENTGTIDKTQAQNMHQSLDQAQIPDKPEDPPFQMFWAIVCLVGLVGVGVFIVFIVHLVVFQIIVLYILYCIIK